MTEAVLGSAHVNRLWRKHVVSAPKEGGQKHVERAKKLDIKAVELHRECLVYDQLHNFKLSQNWEMQIPTYVDSMAGAHQICCSVYVASGIDEKNRKRSVGGAFKGT